VPFRWNSPTSIFKYFLLSFTNCGLQLTGDKARVDLEMRSGSRSTVLGGVCASISKTHHDARHDVGIVIANREKDASRVALFCGKILRVRE